MEFIPFKHKLVAVLNKKIEIGRALNALAHMSVGLGGSMPNIKELRLQNYADADGTIHPNISDIPYIVLRGTSGQIRNLRKAAIEKGLHYTDFTRTMITDTYIEQHARTKETKEEDLEYFGMCLFGEKELVTELTKKFSLYR